MPSSSCSPTTAGTWVRRASPSGTPTRETAPAWSPLPTGSEEPPAWLDRGLALSFGGGLLRRQNLEHSRAAHWAYALQRGPAVRHFHLLGIRNLALGLALHAVAFIRGHRGFTSLRHCAPPSGARQGAGCSGCGQGRLPRHTPSRDGDNIILRAQIVGARSAGGASEKPFRL